MNNQSVTARNIATMITQTSGRSNPMSPQQRSALLVAMHMMRQAGYPGTAKQLESILVGR